IVHNGVAKREITPFLSLIVPAYNESSNIVRKIYNSLALDYPAGQLEIVIACDGCKDDTPRLAQEAAVACGEAKRIRVLDFPVNRGKILTLNAAVAECKGEIIVFSDASAILNPDALRLLIRNFGDSRVGSVSGKYTVIKPNEVKIGGSEDIYWKYETFLKTQESELSSTVGGHGHLHAIRAKLYPYPPAGTINDDYIIHASVIAQGWRAVYEPEAVIREEAQEMTGFGRRVRIMAGNFQQLREIKPLLRPLRPFPLFFFFARKVLRLAVPFAMIAAFIANLFLLRLPFYQALLAAQICFYALAATGSFARLRPKFLMLPYYFSMINAAVFLGSYHAFTGLRTMRWK
ncbi:MAG: glycosyltransferase family 2 protein, partial [Bryobacteraceae bacterium]